MNEIATSEKFFTKKTVKTLILSIVLMLVGTIVYFGIHEFSHYITLLLCNGSATEVSVGVESYVGGYIQPQYIPIVALSSFLIPLCISFALVWIKNLYANFIILGFTMANFMNGFLGFVAFLLIDDKAEKMTFDIPLAIIYSQNQTGLFLFVVLCVIACCACLCFTGDRVFKTIEKHI